MSGTNDIAIRAAGLSKLFKVYSRPSDLIWEFVSAKPRSRPFWALRDVSFDVKRGQVVGIIGRNGAGKSTLLKLLAGTLDKTSGELTVNGRVSSILELGTGFNGEYTGRDNIYLGGLMVGMSRDQIRERESWIIDFSELGDFIDQPFRTYSTGMQARLTFATAICIDPDILIVDEALSVGDAKFQRKSFRKIEEFREAGRTILLVSHDLNTISTFCDHAVLLERGRVLDQGEPYRIGQVYYKMLFSGAATGLSVGSGRAGGGAVVEPEPSVTLERDRIVPDSGFAYRADLRDKGLSGDTEIEPNRSEYLLLEDGVELRPAHSEHDLIRRAGSGSYSHWGDTLFFSTSDNSDPRANGRAYSMRTRAAVLAEAAARAAEGGSARPEGATARLGPGARIAADASAYSARAMKVGGAKAEVLDIGILDNDGNRVNMLESGREYTLFLVGVFHEDVENPIFGFLIRNVKGVDMWGADTRGVATVQAFRRGELLEGRLRLRMWLTNGDYFLSGGIGDTSGASFDFRYDAVQFALPRLRGIQHASVVNLQHSFEWETLPPPQSDDRPDAPAQD